MASYTTVIGDRTASSSLKLTRQEAEDMQAAGLRFAEYNLEHDRYRVSMPYQVLIFRDRGLVTFEQA
jgi:hypothetical protein